MTFLTHVLERMFGKARLVLFAGSRPAVEIRVEGKEIILDVKNLVLAAELGITEFIRRTERTDEPLPEITEELKKLGYKIVIKYGRLEIKI